MGELKLILLLAALSPQLTEPGAHSLRLRGAVGLRGTEGLERTRGFKGTVVLKGAARPKLRGADGADGPGVHQLSAQRPSLRGGGAGELREYYTEWDPEKAAEGLEIDGLRVQQCP